jgi:hypothetical protein
LCEANKLLCYFSLSNENGAAKHTLFLPLHQQSDRAVLGQFQLGRANLPGVLQLHFRPASDFDDSTTVDSKRSHETVERVGAKAQEALENSHATHAPLKMLFLLLLFLGC